MGDVQNRDCSLKNWFRRLINPLLWIVGGAVGCVLFFFVFFKCVPWLIMVLLLKATGVSDSDVVKHIEFTRDPAVLAAVSTPSGYEPIFTDMSNPPATATDLKQVAKDNKCAQQVLRAGRPKFLKSIDRPQGDDAQLWRQRDMVEISAYCVTSEIINIQQNVIKSIATD